MMMDLPAGTLALGMGSITGAAAAGRRLARISGEKSRLCAGYVMLAGKLNHNAARNSIRFGETFPPPPRCGRQSVSDGGGLWPPAKFRRPRPPQSTPPPRCPTG